MLLLFDIDQTLIQVRRGIGRRVVAETFTAVYGVDPTSALETYSFGGRTDRSIVHDMAAACGMSPQQAETGWDAYRTELERRMLIDVTSDAVEVLPGVPDLIRQLTADTSHTLALVTGNVRRIAFHKLAMGDLDHAFHLGAFGCEHADRSMLPPLAVERVNDALGTSYTSADCLVIGDAPNDIACALANGMQALCVATGGHSADDLRRAGAHTVLPSFAHVHQAMQAIAAFG